MIQDINSDTESPTDSKSGTQITFDPDTYRHHLSELDLSEDQQTELLQTLWHIMSTFVDIGWGVDTVQMFLPELFDQSSQSALAEDSQDTLDSKEAANKPETTTETGGR